MRSLKDLEKELRISQANNPDLFYLALTHPSYNADANTKHEDYEKLEFMGDAVLDFVSADIIYKAHPEMDQGMMSKLRSYLVKSHSLANYARKMGLAEYIRVGRSIPLKQIESSDKILEDVFEALIGAIYLDQGISVAYRHIERFLYDDVVHANMDVLTDYKTKLQEEMQAEHRDSVHYELINQSGPAHDRTFTVNVMFNDIVLATGTGKSKKAAEEEAAKNALAKRSV
ncbi:MAG: ribonuclease III [Bacilli bacterium]|nr:ribonuclease III [Bacilli bacterium]